MLAVRNVELKSNLATFDSLKGVVSTPTGWLLGVYWCRPPVTQHLALLGRSKHHGVLKRQKQASKEVAQMAVKLLMNHNIAESKNKGLGVNHIVNPLCVVCHSVSLWFWAS